jgi:hypothetical protein
MQHREKMPRRVRCNECVHRVNLLGNDVNIMCGVTNMVEPLHETLFCEDYVMVKAKK